MFDPYRKWLGILPKDQPPNHYRLLSLELFENDLDVIEGAADRAMGFVRQYQSGEHAALAAKLLNEVATARLCLLKSNSKAEYDAQLKRQLAEKEASSDEMPSFVDDVEVAALMKASKPLSKKKKKSAKSVPVNYLVAGGLGAVVLVLLLVISSGSGSKPPVKPEPAEAVTARDATTHNTPTPKDSAAEEAALRAKGQLEEVSKKLKELNPGFDGILKGFNDDGPPKIEDGVVTELKVITDNITDLSPLSALTGLKALGCYGTGNWTGKITDLSPLRGMKLEQLNCGMSQVSDLSPLAQMPLKVLWCHVTNVADLSPLRGMRLVELQIWSTKVTDLSPLQGMPLEILVVANTGVTDVRPLQGMPLKNLGLFWTPVSDLSPLRHMNLQTTSISPEFIKTGIEVLRQMQSLKTITTSKQSNSPVEEFWKRFDSGEYGQASRGKD